MMLEKRKVLPFFWAIVFSIALLNIRPVSSVTPTARLYTDPPILRAALDENFSFNITILGATYLYSWAVNMSFNPDVLEFVNVTEGDFLKSQPEGTSRAGLLVGNGWAYFGWSTFGAYPGISGGGILASMEFRVTASNDESALAFANNTRLLLQETLVFPPDFEDIPFIAQDGLFTNKLTPPVADFTISPPFPGIDQNITFDASASSGGSNATSTFEISEYFWDFGDGTNSTVGPIINHTYTTGAIFTASLTVFDNATASPLVRSQFPNDTRVQNGFMPRIWYELYSTKQITITIAFGHDIAVTNVALSKDEVVAGESVLINVTVFNKGAAPEDFSVTVYCGTYELDPKQESLNLGEEKTLIFSWDTTGVPAGAYQIKAEASEVADEGDVNDNKFIDGTVKVIVGPEQFPSTLVILGGAIGVVAVLIVIALIYRRRRSVPST